MNDIKLYPSCYDNALVCPVCGGNNLHQEGVTLYERVMDANTVLVTHVRSGDISVAPLPATKAGNPSSDRNALAVEFWCENCHGELNGMNPKYVKYFRLQIQQHKGTTFLDWDIPKK